MIRFDLAALASTLVCSFALVGCSGDSPETMGAPGSNETTSAAGGATEPPAAVVYRHGGGATELHALLAATPKSSAKPKPVFDSPPPVSIFGKGDPTPTFAWKLEPAVQEDGRNNEPSNTTQRAYLRFSTDTEPELLRVFTGGASFLPDHAAWNSLSVGTWVTVSIETATFDSKGALEGDVAEGDVLQFCSDWQRL